MAKKHKNDDSAPDLEERISDHPLFQIRQMGQVLHPETGYITAPMDADTIADLSGWLTQAQDYLSTKQPAETPVEEQEEQHRNDE